MSDYDGTLACNLCGEHADEPPPSHPRFRKPLCARHEHHRDDLAEYLEGRLEAIERERNEQRWQWESWHYHWGGDEHQPAGITAQDIWSSWPTNGDGPLCRY